MALFNAFVQGGAYDCYVLCLTTPAWNVPKMMFCHSTMMLHVKAIA